MTRGNSELVVFVITLWARPLVTQSLSTTFIVVCPIAFVASVVGPATRT